MHACMQLKNKEALIQTVLLHESLLKRKLPLEEIRKGLSSLGLLEIITAFPATFKNYFVPCKNVTIKEEILMNIQFEMISASGDSNVHELNVTWLKEFISGMKNEGIY